MQRIAAIDLGTNTCNLLIADIVDNKLHTIKTERRIVKLLETKTTNGSISNNAIKRCVNAFIDYKNIIDSSNTHNVIALATSGLRNAPNQSLIIQEIYNKTEIKPQIINGKTEANLIFKGVSHLIESKSEINLLLDIGGGSNEFIAFNYKNMLFSFSFDVGIARVLNMFKFSDPLSENDINTLEKLFKNTFLPLIEKSKDIKYSTLIGSSGTFETLASVFNEFSGNKHNNNFKTNIPINDFNIISKNILSKTIGERKLIQGMDLMRVEMIPIAVVLVQFVLKTFNIKQITYSKYSLKEGVIIDKYINK